MRGAAFQMSESTSSLATLGRFAFVLLVCLCTSACDRDGAKNRPTRPRVLVISADTAGWITPCGCTSNQSGGLLRRGSFLAEKRRSADLLYADAGGAAGPSPADYQKLKFEAILAGETKMGLAAHNLGASEAAFGPDYLRDAARRLGVPFVSANLRDSEGRLVSEPVRVAEAGGRRIAMVGVLSPKFAGPGERVDDPRQAVLSAAARAKGTYDSLVVLAYLPQDELEQLAANLPEADVVVGGPTGQPIQPRLIGPTLLASATNKGKFLVELSVPAPLAGKDSGPAPAPAPWSGKIVEMGAAVPDQAEQKQVLRDFHAELGKKDFAAEQTGLVAPLPPNTPAGYRVAGTGSCAGCHPAEQEAWKQSKHAGAWKTLVDKGFDVDPSCMQCHTTGYGLPGGFVSRGKSAARVDVGCENCHGPSQAHVADPKVRTPYLASDRCTSCHDHENSPNFDYNAYWPRVRHGRKT